MWKVVPSPGALATLIAPAWSATVPYTDAKPSPVPLPIGLVVKNGSKMCSRASGLMPSPVSVTESLM